MKCFVAVVLLTLACAGLALAGEPATQSSNVADVLLQLEQDFGHAISDVDLDRISQIVADDYRSVGISGRPADKASVLEYVRSGKSRLEWFEIGSRDVKVLGDDVAVVQAIVNEKRKEAGVTLSVSIVYMDVWAKRENRWMLVRSQTVKMK